MIAALFVETNGCYFGLEGVDPWDITRDARNYAGPHPVVAHPPCKTWSVMAQCRPEIARGSDGGCFSSAISSVRTWGGVLEHPAHSLAWTVFGLPRPMSAGWMRNMFADEWVCEVDQAHYGHRANKRTWLLCCGATPPSFRWGRAPFTGVTVRNDGGGGRDQRSRTPAAFRDALIGIARNARSGVKRSA